MPIPNRISVNDVKRDKRNRIYNYIYQKRVTSRLDVAHALGLSLPTVSQYTQELQDIGLIEESGILDSTGGRKPVALSCCPAARLSLGLSISPQNISGVIVDLYGTIVASSKQIIAFERTPEYSAAIEQMVQQLISNAKVANGQLLGGTISVPGIVSADGEEVTYSHVIPIHLKYGELLQNRHFPGALCNDASAAGFAELWNQPLENTAAAYLSLNNTVGGAIIFGRAIYAGANNRSGEFGHMSVSRNGPRCQCGQRGCLDCYCSALVLSSDYGQDLDRFFTALEDGDSHAQSLWMDYLDYLTSGITMIRSVLDCDVIIGGEVGARIGPYMETVRDLIRARSPFGDDASFVYPCRHKRMASSVGAALQLVHAFLITI